jgi:putative ABC transport system permease protein
MLHKLAWFQLITEKRRLAAALAGIAFAVMLQLTEFGVRDALFESAISFHKHLVADLVLTSSLYENGFCPVEVASRLYQAPRRHVESVVLSIGLAPFGTSTTASIRRSSSSSTPLKRCWIFAVGDNHRSTPDVALYDRRPDRSGAVLDIVGADGEVTTEVAGRRTHRRLRPSASRSASTATWS